MKLLTVGDSFTYGEELAELTSAWPNLLADKLGYDLENLARPGSGNTRMVRHCIEQVDNYDIVIIAWSHWARIEFADTIGIFDIWPRSSGAFFSGESAHRQELVKYVNRYHSDQYLYNQYLINIILTQSFLTQNNKKYIMLDAFGNTSGRQLSSDLVKQIDSTYFLGWPNESMMEWTYGTSQGPREHFLEDGHRIVANKINEYIRHLGWVP
jgi:hypothetical protein